MRIEDIRKEWQAGWGNLRSVTEYQKVKRDKEGKREMKTVLRFFVEDKSPVYIEYDPDLIPSAKKIIEDARAKLQ